MKKRLAIFIAILAALALAVGAWLVARSSSRAATSSSASSSTQALRSSRTRAQNGTGAKSIVVYFSRTQGVYNGPLEVGNTARIAQFIQQDMNADTYEILPAEDYPAEYEATARQAREEQQNDARPAIAGSLPDLSGYDTIFIGAPVWWGEYPMIVRTFLDAEADQLSGKTLVPFTTHLGSGLGNTQSQLTRQFPDSTVLDGFTVRGDDAADAAGDVQTWLNRIGLGA